jgi:hypothetical protein
VRAANVALGVLGRRQTLVVFNRVIEWVKIGVMDVKPIWNLALMLFPQVPMVDPETVVADAGVVPLRVLPATSRVPPVNTAIQFKLNWRFV